MDKNWWKKEIVYQIYPRSFKDSNNDGIGDIRGIIDRLDYLKDLGISMIWICPIFKSPMVDNGYDVSSYYEINEEFGDAEDFDELIKEAENRGIKIMLDLVLNHTSSEHPWFKEAISNKQSPYRNYYIFKESKDIPNNWRSVFGGSVWEKVDGEDCYYFHSFHKKQPDLNWENPQVREEIYKIVNYWIDKGIRAFRLDAINFLKKNQSYRSLDADGADGLSKCTKSTRNQFGLDVFLEELNNRTFKRKDCMTVGETAGLRYNQLEEYIGQDGYFSMVFDFKAADLDIESGSEWFKRIDWKVNDLNRLMLDSQINMQKYGWTANFLENHDQPRSTTKLLRTYENNIMAKKMLASLFFLMRGTPFIYQGQELGMVNFNRDSIDKFNDLSSIDQYQRSIDEGFSKEEALKIVNLRSRDNARVPFVWNDTDFLGFSNCKPWIEVSKENIDNNLEDQKSDEESLYNFYKSMIELRQNSEYSDILTYGYIVEVDTEDENLIAYERSYEGKEITCYFNFQDKKIEIEQKGKIIFTNARNKDSSGEKIKLDSFQMILIGE